MKHEKIIKRPGGGRVMIAASVSIVGHGYDDKAVWTYTVHTCKPGGRKFIHQVGYGEGIVTPEEIQEAKIELYAKLKP